MRFLILSDTHANWHALDAVLKDATGQYDQIICCGDLVGYNPQPGKVIDWTRAHCASVIRGNHDKVVAGLEDLDWFNDVAQSAARWTIDQLEPKQVGYLHELPTGPLELEHFHIWHGSPRDEDEYIVTGRDAAECFPYFALPLAFFGHTHLQGGFFARGGRVSPIPAVRHSQSESVWQLEPDTTYLINPGSVGQPRDGDARAAYAIYDSEPRIATLRRVAYPIGMTAAEIRSAGLPDVLALRLYQGL